MFEDHFNILTIVNTLLLTYVLIQPSWTLLFVTAVAVAVFIGLLTRSKSRQLPMREGKYFGWGPKVDDDPQVVEFNIEVPNDEIEELKLRLKNARLYAAPEGTKFHYGFNLDFLVKVRDYWLNTYNWKVHEDQLNQFKHFRTQIEGLMVHFVHAKPPANKYKNVEPLLIVHGWPGSVYEFLKAIPMLTDPLEHGTGSANFAFEVIAPSIPGFGWSEAPHKKGFAHPDAAHIFKELMTRLGHHRFFCQGGDWGSVIVTDLSIAYPECVIGLHQNMLNVRSQFRPALQLRALLAMAFPLLVVDREDYNKVRPVMPIIKRMLQETGYFHIQATKPDSLGAALNDSPVGLAAWILEKFSTATNYEFIDREDGGLQTANFTMDELLTNVSIYWFTKTAGTSIRFYKTAFDESTNAYNREIVTVPTAAAIYPNEPLNSPRTFVEYRYVNLQRYTRMPRGGHFAAFEQPSMFAHDVLEFAEDITDESTSL